MSHLSLTVYVTHSRSTVVRIVSTVYNRGWEIHRFYYTRGQRDDQGVLKLTAMGGNGNLDSHLRNLVGVLRVETETF